MSDAKRFLFHWLDATTAARAVLDDELAPAWVHYLPAEARMAPGVVLSERFSPPPRLADRRVVMVFDRLALPAGGMDVDGDALHALTNRVLGAKASGDAAALRRLVARAKADAARFSEEPNEHFVTEPLAPSRDGMLLVGVVAQGMRPEQLDMLRRACEECGVTVLAKATPLELAAAIGTEAAAHVARKDEEARRAAHAAQEAAKRASMRATRRAQLREQAVPDLYDELTRGRDEVLDFYRGEDPDLPSRRVVDLGPAGFICATGDGYGIDGFRMVERAGDGVMELAEVAYGRGGLFSDEDFFRRRAAAENRRYAEAAGDGGPRR